MRWWPKPPLTAGGIDYEAMRERVDSFAEQMLAQTAPEPERYGDQVESWETPMILKLLGAYALGRVVNHLPAPAQAVADITVLDYVWDDDLDWQRDQNWKD